MVIPTPRTAVETADLLPAGYAVGIRENGGTILDTPAGALWVATVGKFVTLSGDLTPGSRRRFALSTDGATRLAWALHRAVAATRWTDASGLDGITHVPLDHADTDLAVWHAHVTHVWPADGPLVRVFLDTLTDPTSCFDLHPLAATEAAWALLRAAAATRRVASASAARRVASASAAFQANFLSVDSPPGMNMVITQGPHQPGPSLGDRMAGIIGRQRESRRRRA